MWSWKAVQNVLRWFLHTGTTATRSNERWYATNGEKVKDYLYPHKISQVAINGLRFLLNTDHEFPAIISSLDIYQSINQSITQSIPFIYYTVAEKKFCLISNCNKTVPLSHSHATGTMWTCRSSTVRVRITLMDYGLGLGLALNILYRICHIKKFMDLVYRRSHERC